MTEVTLQYRIKDHHECILYGYAHKDLGRVPTVDDVLTVSDKYHRRNQFGMVFENDDFIRDLKLVAGGGYSTDTIEVLGVLINGVPYDLNKH